jgi:hypothetical protein
MLPSFISPKAADVLSDAVSYPAIEQINPTQSSNTLNNAKFEPMAIALLELLILRAQDMNPVINTVIRKSPSILTIPTFSQSLLAAAQATVSAVPFWLPCMAQLSVIIANAIMPIMSIQPIAFELIIELS